MLCLRPEVVLTRTTKNDNLNDQLFIKIRVPTRKNCQMLTKGFGISKVVYPKEYYMLKACTLEAICAKKNTEKTTGRAPQMAKGFHSENFIRRTVRLRRDF